MTIDDMISALEDARGQVGGNAPTVLENDGRGWEVEITAVFSVGDLTAGKAVIR